MITVTFLLFRLNLTPFIPLSFEGKGEELGEGAKPLQTTLQINQLSYTSQPGKVKAKPYQRVNNCMGRIIF